MFVGCLVRCGSHAYHTASVGGVGGFSASEAAGLCVLVGLWACGLCGQRLLVGGAEQSAAARYRRSVVLCGRVRHSRLLPVYSARGCETHTELASAAGFKYSNSEDEYSAAPSLLYHVLSFSLSLFLLEYTTLRENRKGKLLPRALQHSSRLWFSTIHGGERARRAHSPGTRPP